MNTSYGHCGSGLSSYYVLRWIICFLSLFWRILFNSGSIVSSYTTFIIRLLLRSKQSPPIRWPLNVPQWSQQCRYSDLIVSAKLSMGAAVTFLLSFADTTGDVYCCMLQ
ncbi:hypothetical protein SETIT_7G288100v2 [Setaria italica]|uniref:Uncharacterized protein n=1 Tax=Setaria italica TaxID=4555 RepID=A0A368S0W8_SETIT|nr:hypothetical protein SETIT_7G288100v2 [Setaria italica]